MLYVSKESKIIQNSTQDCEHFLNGHKNYLNLFRIGRDIHLYMAHPSKVHFQISHILHQVSAMALNLSSDYIGMVSHRAIYIEQCPVEERANIFKNNFDHIVRVIKFTFTWARTRENKLERFHFAIGTKCRLRLINGVSYNIDPFCLYTNSHKSHKTKFC